MAVNFQVNAGQWALYLLKKYHRRQFLGVTLSGPLTFIPWNPPRGKRKKRLIIICQIGTILIPSQQKISNRPLSENVGLAHVMSSLH